MNTFNREAAEAARYNDPSLTIFETGEMLEPHLALEAPKPNGPLTGAPGPKTGTVDFDDSEGSTVLTMFAHPSTEDDNTVILEIDAPLFSRLKIVVNDGELAALDTEGNATFLTREIQEAIEAAHTALDSGVSDAALIDLLRLLEGNDPA
jgi:hypothetical protein